MKMKKFLAVCLALMMVLTCIPAASAAEVADATIMLEQLRLMFGINGEVCAIMDAKVERLRQKIEQS